MAPLWIPWIVGALSTSSSSNTNANTNSNSNNEERSPWAPAEWRIDVNIGREPGTYMPADWGASGARLMFPLLLRFESENDDSNSNTNNRDDESDFLGMNPYRLQVLEDPAFVTIHGEEIVYFQDTGAWKIGLRRGGQVGDANKIRFWVDLDVANDDSDSDDSDSDDNSDNIAATRNDVVLSAERLYFVANCWRRAEYQKGVQRYRPIQAAAQEAQETLDRELSHETGDRRLDGTNALDTARATLDMAQRVARRDKNMLRLQDADRILPNPQKMKSNGFGFWPGSTEELIIAPGTIGVQRKSNNLLGGDEFHIVGTWTAQPLDGLSDVVFEDG